MSKFCLALIYKFTILLLFLIIVKNGFSQIDSSFIKTENDSIKVNSTDLAKPSGNISIVHIKNYYRYVSDQFPSFILMKVEGLTVESAYEKSLNRGVDDWKFWYALALFAFLTFIRFFYPKDFEELKLTFRNWGMNQQTIRELGVGVPLGTVLLNIFSVFSISYYLFIIIWHYQLIIIEPSWILLVFSFMLVSASILLRYLLLKISEIIFPFRKEVSLYNYYELQINRIIGIALFPLSVVATFGTNPVNISAIYFSVPVLATLLFIRYLKGLNIGFAYFGNYIIHFLLYICALEIAPVLIVIRLLLNIEPIRFLI